MIESITAAALAATIAAGAPVADQALEQESVDLSNDGARIELVQNQGEQFATRSFVPDLLAGPQDNATYSFDYAQQPQQSQTEDVVQGQSEVTTQEPKSDQRLQQSGNTTRDQMQQPAGEQQGRMPQGWQADRQFDGSQAGQQQGAMQQPSERQASENANEPDSSEVDADKAAGTGAAGVYESGSDVSESASIEKQALLPVRARAPTLSLAMTRLPNLPPPRLPMLLSMRL